MSRWTPVALVAALAAALAATWPAASSPSDTILCNFVHPDCLSNHWLMVWVADQLRTGGSILHNDRYYWPVGDSPWLAGNGSEGFAYLPWHLLFGWPVASTVHLVSLVFLNGVAAYAIARASGASGPAALAAAPSGALLVYAVQELGAGRFTQVSLCWLGFFCAAWIRLLVRPGTGRALLAAFLLAWTCLFYWYYGFFGVVAGALLLGAKLIADRGASRATLVALAVFAVAFLLLISPLLWIFLDNWTGIVGTAEDVFPHPEAMQDATWPGIPFLATGGRHSGRALPLSTCLLALVALIPRRGGDLAPSWPRWGLLVVALFFAGLMAGPLLPHGPYQWVYGLAGPLRRFWWPYRHVVVLNLALIALAAHGLDRLFGAGRARAVVGVALALSIPLQLTVQDAPWHSQFTRAEVPVPFYVSLAETPGTILLEPPLSPQIASAQTQLIYQLDHHKQLLTGHALWVDRVRPAAWDSFVAGNSFLAQLQKLERAELAGTFTFDPAHLRSLLDGGNRVIVINREYFPIAMADLVEAYMTLCNEAFGPAILSGKRVKAWDMGAWNGASSYPFTPFAWPAGIAPGGPTLAIQGFRAPSLAFSIPAPTGPSPRSKGGPR